MEDEEKKAEEANGASQQGDQPNPPAQQSQEAPANGATDTPGSGPEAREVPRETQGSTHKPELSGDQLPPENS